MALSADGRIMLTGSQSLGTKKDFSLRLWSIDSGKEFFRFLDHKDGVWEIALTGDARYAASCDGNGNIIWFWHLPTEA